MLTNIEFRPNASFNQKSKFKYIFEKSKYFNIEFINFFLTIFSFDFSHRSPVSLPKYLLLMLYIVFYHFA